MTRHPSGECEPVTTNGTIAVANLHAQIAGLAAQARPVPPGQPAAPLAVATRALLVDLLILRGEVLARIADYEQAAELAERLVHDAPDNGTALLARARIRSVFHRFVDALADLDVAGQSGLDRATVDAERAPILQATGCYWHALVLCESADKRRPGFTTAAALAVLQAERGEVAAAERLFAQARCRYGDISPFPIASLDYRRGMMWLARGALRTARCWFDAAQRRVPSYAPAQGRLAEVDAALGAHEAAIGRLRPLVSSSDDPQYAATLARVLAAAGYRREARKMRFSAAARHGELVLRHPEAFAHHTPDFTRESPTAPATLRSAS